MSAAHPRSRHRAIGVVAFTAASLALATPGTALADNGHRGHDRLAVNQVNLVSDLNTFGPDVLVDPDVVNPWGLALGPATPLWSANNVTSSATLFASAAGATTATLVGAIRVGVPVPTGQVFNGTDGFVTTNPDNGASGPARFIFSTLSGQIAAWAPPPVGPAQGPAQLPVTTPGAVYTGLALATAAAGPQLYAANFAQGTVDVFDSTFAPVTLASGSFHDRRLPAGYSPFGIQMLQGNVFVAYAQVDPVTHRNAVGVGLGFVDEYSPEGVLLDRVAKRHTLNAPWGMAIAPASWGRLAGALLVGNFGDGRINVLEAEDRDRHGDRDGDHDAGFKGGIKLLTDANTGKTLVIPGLWALLPGTATTGGVDSVWFSAGIENETHGLIGVLRRPSSS
jgi:uncharacterized protein (TIGR03118 family)